MLIFEQILFKGTEARFYLKTIAKDENIRKNVLVLSLTAEERSRNRYRFQSDDGQDLFIRLPRGKYVDDGDLLQANTGEFLIIKAKPQDVLTITSSDYLLLIKAAYHIGNRHAAMEITSNYLRIAFDPVLEKMLTELGLEIYQEKLPFYPEKGAYQH